jgi:hypothetical protein
LACSQKCGAPPGEPCTIFSPLLQLPPQTLLHFVCSFSLRLPL